MSQKSPVPSEWVERLAAFKRFTSAAELAESHAPAHKIQSPGMEIWHYPLGANGGMLYAIHVAVSPGHAPMAYMHMEPTSVADTVQLKESRPWWRFW